ncbi:MAG: TauD/TfdA family dioxygenase [Deltaproteobacteria bacterium]|nr:TauD/TfdA family dioxygenase [Deltaproteobacteria bacterium]
MALKITQLENVGVEVSGFDITQTIDEALKSELISLWNDHAIVLFRGQNVDPKSQIEFSRIFGSLAMHPLQETTSAEYPELFMLVNEAEKEKYHTATYNGELIVGRLDWHWDLLYTAKPNRGALLRSVVCAEEDGLTGFADMAKAYDALDADTKSLLEKIEVAYCFSMNRCHMRYVDLEGYKPGPYSPTKPADVNFPNFPDVAYPAVITHPETGRKILKICDQFLDRIVAPHKAGLSNDEAVDLLERLVAHIRKPEFHYFHQWNEGDMVLWDNWNATHYATGTKPGVKRVIHRTTIEGDATLGRVLETS